MKKLSIDDLDLAGKRVLVRVDYNVPIEDGKVSDDRRIAATLPTLRKILGAGGRPILIAHLGRPKHPPRVEGEPRRNAAPEGDNAKFSLAPVAARLRALLPDVEVTLAADITGVVAAEAVLKLQQSAGPALLLLENVRFHPGEEENDLELARELASYGDVFINDAFGASHRAHASIVGIPQLLKAAAGYLLKKELDTLTALLGPTTPKPFVALLGGAKVSDKIGILENLVPRLDAVLVGGAMAYTFLCARGTPVGKSKVEPEKLEVARTIMALAEERKCALLLPEDHVAASLAGPDGGATAAPVPKVVETLGPDDVGLDIGPRTATAYRARLEKAKTVIWNGPMGVFEKKGFDGGTRVLAMSLAQFAKKGQIVVLGGGETAECAERFSVAKDFTHVSTGGGAFLEALEGKELPGLTALTDA